MTNPIGVFPATHLKFVASGATAGNVVYDLAPPAFRRYQVVALRVSLVTDATVATRNIIISWEDGSGNVGSPKVWGADRAASGTTVLAIGPYVLNTGGAWNSDNAVYGLASPISLFGAIILRITINNGVAGDSYTVQSIVEECDA